MKLESREETDREKEIQREKVWCVMFPHYFELDRIVGVQNRVSCMADCRGWRGV